MLLGIVALYSATGTLNFRDILYNHQDGNRINIDQILDDRKKASLQEDEEEGKEQHALYKRGDGTLSYFFTLEEVQHLFRNAGMVPVEGPEYHTVTNRNRKTREAIRRVFVHAVFRKI